MVVASSDEKKVREIDGEEYVEDSLTHRLNDSLHGRDEPMEENHPLAPAALVFLTYPVILIVGIGAVILTLWLFGVFGGAGSTVPAVPLPAP